MEKALAKARTGTDSAKKAKTAASIEVNSRQVGSKAGETDLFLHSSDFRPRGSLRCTPWSPTPDRTVGDQIPEAVLVPLTELKRSDKKKRSNDAMRIICTSTDQ